MKVRVERGLVYGRDSKSPYSQTYTQPLRNHIAYRLYHFYDMRVYKVPGFKQLERLLWRWHDRTCDNDCSTGLVWRKETGEEKEERFCAYMPIGCQQDMRCFDLSRKNRVDLTREFDNGHG